MSVGWAWGQRQVTNHLRLTPARYPCPRGQICPHLQQEVPQGHKGGSVLWFVSPALNHDIVDVLGAVLGPGQTLPLLVNLMQDLVVGRCSLRTSRAPGSSPLISPPSPRNSWNCWPPCLYPKEELCLHPGPLTLTPRSGASEQGAVAKEDCEKAQAGLFLTTGGRALCSAYLGGSGRHRARETGIPTGRSQFQQGQVGRQGSNQPPATLWGA